MTLYWVNFTGAVINGWWWWWLAPIIVVGILFISLFLISIGLDEIANPRLRTPGLISAPCATFDGAPASPVAPTPPTSAAPMSSPRTTSPSR